MKEKSLEKALDAIDHQYHSAFNQYLKTGNQTNELAQYLSAHPEFSEVVGAAQNEMKERKADDRSKWISSVIVAIGLVGGGIIYSNARESMQETVHELVQETMDAQKAYCHSLKQKCGTDQICKDVVLNHVKPESNGYTCKKYLEK